MINKMANLELLMAKVDSALSVLSGALDELSELAACAGINYQAGSACEDARENLADISSRIEELQRKAVLINFPSVWNLKSDMYALAPPTTIQHMKCNLTPSISVNVLMIPPEYYRKQDIESTIVRSGLYYVIAWRQFAIKINGILFHSGIGNIYPLGTKRPLAVKECNILNSIEEKHRNDPSFDVATALTQCKKSTYYHDPVRVAAMGVYPPEYLNTTRNFISNRTTGFSRQERYGKDKYGSADTIEIDIATMSPSAVRRHMDRVSHDIVCAVILAENSRHA